MFAIAFLIGTYANLILLLGFTQLLTQPIILGMTIIFILLSVWCWKRFDEPFSISRVREEAVYGMRKYPLIYVFFLICFGLILIGAIAPETAFDSLWYHLTLPKIYLAEKGIVAIPGGLLYYSTMPKLGELLYTAALAVNTEILAKLIHASFAFLTGVAIYLIAKNYTSRKYALLAVAIFFSNIVVLWEATTAYIDLIRTFFEVMSLWGLLEYLKTGKRKWLIESAVLMGLAIETKLIAVASLGITLLVLMFIQRRYAILKRIKDCLMYLVLAMIVPMPWFAFSFLHMGNPFYPLFSVYQIHLGEDTLAFPQLLIDPITIFFQSSDPISPLYLIFFPLLFVIYKKIPRESKVIYFFAFLSLIAWTLTPKTGGGRFLLPYLPVLTIATTITLSLVNQRFVEKIVLATISLVCLISVMYRGVATIKYLPVVLGLETKEKFLSNNLNFDFGDFADIDGQFAKHVKPGSRVLLYGFHNLYYVNVPFIHSSWVREGDTFDYIATQRTKLPVRFHYWQPIYTNTTTGVTLYTGGQRWVY